MSSDDVNGSPSTATGDKDSKDGQGWIYSRFMVPPEGDFGKGQDPLQVVPEQLMPSVAKSTVSSHKTRPLALNEDEEHPTSSTSSKPTRKTRPLYKKRHHLKFLFMELNLGWRPILLIFYAALLCLGIFLGWKLLEQFLPAFTVALTERWLAFDDTWTIGFDINQVAIAVLVVIFIGLSYSVIWKLMKAFFIWSGEIIEVTQHHYRFTTPRSRIFNLPGAKVEFDAEGILGVEVIPTTFDNWITRNCANATLQLREVEGNADYKFLRAVKSPDKFEKAINQVIAFNKEVRRG